jgi:hypothetical protein
VSLPPIILGGFGALFGVPMLGLEIVMQVIRGNVHHDAIFQFALLAGVGVPLLWTGPTIRRKCDKPTEDSSNAKVSDSWIKPDPLLSSQGNKRVRTVLFFRREL